MVFPQPIIRKLLVGPLVVVLATLAVIGVIGGSTRGVSAATNPAPTRGLGFYPGFAKVEQFHALESWLGRHATHVVQFADADSDQFTSSVWGTVTNVGAFQDLSHRITMVNSIPLAFGNNLDAKTPEGQAQARSNLQATVNGAHDARFRRAALYIRDGGFADAILRLGWEFDGGWYPWSSQGNCDVFQAAYRRVHNIFASVSPEFRFDWNATSRHLAANAQCAWPGNDYVDIVGLDYYDKGHGVPYDSTAKTWVDPAGAFESRVLPNLRIHRDWAIAHGKQVSFPEWALSGGGPEGVGGGDNPAFIEGMHAWLSSLPASGPGSLSYQSYFNSDAKHDGAHALHHFPESQARYRHLFGSATPVDVDETPTPAPATPPVGAPPSIPDAEPEPLPTDALGSSDEFNGTLLRAPWLYTNVARDTNAWVQRGSLTLIAFQGIEHTLTPQRDSSVRVTQPLAAGDFSVDTAYRSVLTEDGVWQGVSLDLGDQTLLFATRREGGATVIESTLVGATGARALSAEPLGDNAGSWTHFRVSRHGHTLTLAWSSDGTNFSTHTVLTDAGSLASFGPAIGNVALSGQTDAERHVASIDSVRFR